MKQQLSLRLPAEFAPVHYPNLNEIEQCFNILCGRHAALIEKLRKLHSDPEVQIAAPIIWHDLENQVVSLRVEIESFKQIF